MLRCMPADSGVLVSIDGEMNIYAVAELWLGLRDVLANVNGNQLTLDLSAVTELDAAGLQLLLVTAKHCRARDVALTLGERSAAVDQVLQAAWVTSAFDSPLAPREAS